MLHVHGIILLEVVHSFSLFSLKKLKLVLRNIPRSMIVEVFSCGQVHVGQHPVYLNDLNSLERVLDLNRPQLQVGSHKIKSHQKKG